MIILNRIDIKAYWLTGRLYNMVMRPTSNIYKFFTLLNDELNIIIEYANRTYISLYPCQGVELLDEHERELGIPDNIFTSKVTKNVFTYTFPLLFGGGSSTGDSTSISMRRKDIICKKYLMNDNSINGYKRISALYGHAITIDEVQDNISVGSPRGGNASNGIKMSCCRFPYGFPLLFGDRSTGSTIDSYVNVNATGTTITSKTTITIHGNPTDDIFNKLKAIFRFIKRVGIDLEIVRVNDTNVYDIDPYIICKGL